tara:strand:- start:1377 stop:3698 length:2322 start_codon:yes stop_codon:yes gene_type:complete
VTVPSTVELIVKITNAVNPLRQVKKEADKTNESFKKTEDVLRRVTAASNQVKLSIQEQQKSLPKLSQVQGVLAAKVRNSEQAMRAQIKALRDLQVRVNFNGSLYKKLGAEIEKYETRLRSASSTADKAKSSNNGLGASLRKLAVGFGVARAGQRALQAGIQRDESERRLRLLTQRFGETAQAQEAAQRAAEKFNLSQTEANVQLSRLIARLRPMGLSMQTIETAFAGFNTATILAGATASESAGAFLQLSQALGSGVLRGQELNSILEQAPLIAQAIATEMGSTVGALKKFGEDGKITSDIVIRALGRVEREGAGQLEEALKGPAAAIKDFQNAAEDVQVALTQDIIPEMAKSFRELADLILSLGPLFRGVGVNIGGGLGAINDLIDINRMSKPESARSILGRGRIAPGERGLPELFAPLGGKEFVSRLRTQAASAAKVTGKDVTELFVASLQRALKTLDAKTSTLPANFDMMVMNAGGPKTKPTGLSDEEKKRLDKIKQQNILAKTKFFQAQEELAVLLETNEVEKIRLDFAAQRANVQRDYASLIANAKSDEERLNLLGALRNDLQVLSLEQNVAITDVIEKRTKTFSDQLAQQDEFRQAIAEQNTAYEELNTTFRTGIVDGILAAVEGTKSLSDSLLGVIKQMARLILQQQLLNALSGFNLFSFAPSTAGPGGYTIPSGAIPKFANGGRPPVGRPSIVGERGPELFVPDRAGTIVPNGGFGGANVVVNVDASGSSVQGDEGSSRQLGALIGAAVQGEIIKQQRPGGLLSR